MPRRPPPAQRELDALRALLEDAGLIEAGVPFDDGHRAAVALALHALLCRSPAQIVLAGLPDAVGDLRQPNMPGTVDEYPNWRLPVADETGRSLTLEEILAHPGLDALTRLLLAGSALSPGTRLAGSPIPSLTTSVMSGRPLWDRWMMS